MDELKPIRVFLEVAKHLSFARAAAALRMTPASVTRISIPSAFFEQETSYEWEVLAIESSGNQTISSSAFETR